MYMFMSCGAQFLVAADLMVVCSHAQAVPASHTKKKTVEGRAAPWAGFDFDVNPLGACSSWIAGAAGAGGGGGGFSPSSFLSER